jgi:hypothetical protein
MPKSPYEGLTHEEGAAKTEKPIKDHPLSEEEIKDAVFEAWKLIFDSKIGGTSNWKRHFS